jgi:hypothetical protein
MNDDLVGIGGLLGCIVLLVFYALAIGAKTKQQPPRPLKPIQPPTPKPKPVINTTIAKDHEDRRENTVQVRKGPSMPDPATRHTDPDFWKKYAEWYYYYD